MNNNPNNMSIDYDKVLNSKCHCGTGLPWIKGEVVMAYPCEHNTTRCTNAGKHWPSLSTSTPNPNGPSVHPLIPKKE